MALFTAWILWLFDVFARGVGWYHAMRLKEMLQNCTRAE